MTNPPVPATPLDVEACVRLLERLADAAAGRSAADVDYAERHERTHPSVATDHYLSAARFAAEATLLRALASALPGMGKDSERLRQIREQCRVIYYGTTDMYPIEHAPGANKDSWEWMMLHLDAARAAQPQETSADAAQDCYACGHAREQHLNESNELDDCLDCHCSEFMQSPASSPSPERPE